MANLVFETLWRRRNLVLGIVSLAVILGLALTGLEKNIYIATVYFAPQADYETARNDVLAVSPSPLLEQIYKEQGLENLPEFNALKADDGSVVARLAVRLTEMFKPVSNESDLNARAFKRMKRYFTVESFQAERMIALGYASTSPRTAANVANGMAQAYRDALSAKYNFIATGSRSTGTTSKSVIRFTKADIYIKPSRPPVGFDMGFFILFGVVFGIGTSLLADNLQRKAAIS